ncbi:MAG: hypothetical protein Q7T08_07295 [Devosia sp.]|nr:hypothetical protein [Devosia sp.]
MFVGHYGVALALRPLKGAPPLPVLFAAVQVVDIAFFSFLIPGIEKMRIVPGITAMNGMDLYFMPYTHSLLGSAVFSVAFATLVAVLMPTGLRWRSFGISALAVFSHWLLDLLVHRPDLGVMGDSGSKLGFGLWNYPLVAMPIEIAVAGAGLAVCLATTRAIGRTGMVSLAVLIVAMVALQSFNWFGPQPAPDGDLTIFAVEGLAGYAIFIALAWWMERTHRPVR